MIFFFSAAGGADEVIKKIRSKAMKATNYRNDIDIDQWSLYMISMSTKLHLLIVLHLHDQPNLIN